MSSSSEEFCSRLEASFPESRPKMTSFPSGAFMIDVVIEKEVYVIEYLLEQGYGVSRRSTAIFGWEGVEHSFESMAAIEAYVLDLLEMKKPNQAPEPTAPSGRGSS